MTRRALFDEALVAARHWHQSLADVSEFCPWPEDLVWKDRLAHKLPATEQIVTEPGASSAASEDLMRALQKLAPHLEWRLTYTAEEVGQHFLDHFGWFELAGPDGHFVTHNARITVGYWNAGLAYPRHQHVAEELYTVVSGRGLFQSDGDPDEELGPGRTRFHRSNQPHALITTDSPILTMVFWRGDGLADLPALSAA
jgi:mannose-6-phosphate isomerase-like protein (cupin superfamily)